MENSTWAFLDDNMIVIHIGVGNIITMEFNPPILDSFAHMVKVSEERGIAEIGKKWNWEINKFE